MKKFLLMSLCILFLFSLAACSSKPNKEKELKETVEDLNDGKATTDETLDALEDYTDEVKDDYDLDSYNASDVIEMTEKDDYWKEQVESIKKQNMEMSLEDRDNYVTYVYKYTIDVGDNKLVKEQLDNSKETLGRAADSLKEMYTGIDGVIYEYRDMNGDVIVTYKF